MLYAWYFARLTDAAELAGCIHYILMRGQLAGNMTFDGYEVTKERAIAAECHSVSEDIERSCLNAAYTKALLLDCYDMAYLLDLIKCSIQPISTKASNTSEIQALSQGKRLRELPVPCFLMYIVLVLDSHYIKYECVTPSAARQSNIELLRIVAIVRLYSCLLLFISRLLLQI